MLVALVAAGIAGFSVLSFVVVAGYGAMWLFIFGDDTWPRGADLFAQYGLTSIGLLAGAVVAWAAFRAVWRS